MSLARIIEVAGKIPLVAGLLRRMARRYPEGSVVTIRSGHAAGLQWKRYHRYVNGYWLGQYELPLQEVLVRELSPGGVFFDVGANAGFFTLVAAKRVGPSGKCCAFEPLPENAAAVRSQLELNGLSYCHLVTEAVSDHEGTESFSLDAGESYSTAHLGAGGSAKQTFQVKVNTLDHYCQLYGMPDLVKMDIEGAELDALKGATAMLRDKPPTIVVELHTPQCEAGVIKLLSDAGYQCCELDGGPLQKDQRLPRHVLCRPTR
jgi:FkbM family methyltransferase